MPPLRLVHKLILAFGLVILVTVSLVGWHLATIDRLTRETRVIIRQALPAVRLEVLLLEAVWALRRLEGRHTVLRDPAYLALFDERAQAMGADLLRLEPMLATHAERGALGEARTRLADYRAFMRRGGGAAPAAGHPAERLDAALGQLYRESGVELGHREAAAQALHERSRLVGLAGLAVAVSVGLGVAAFAALRIARPLRRLQAATRHVAERRFSEPIPVRGQDEVAELTQAFNQMATRLKELDRLKEDFFSAVSHDLRTPLASIRWSAEILEGQTSGPLTARQSRVVTNIRASTDRLLSLVNQILELGRLRAGKLRLDLRPTDLRRVAEASAEELRPLAEQGQLQLEVAIDERIPPIPADGDRIHQVLVNLLGNSVKFTPAGGRVSLRATLGEESVLVRVEDTGIGIPAHLLPSIFDQYQQAHQGQGGTGIGLTVVKGFVEAHGGRVWVESQEGCGTCFTVALPLIQRAG